MLVVTCIKQVPDTTQVEINPETNTLVREGIPIIVNPYDTHAMEEGLRLKDRFGVKVAAISMGPPNAEAALRKACSIGVDQAILCSDRAFGGADTLATSRVLAAAIEKLGVDDEAGYFYATNVACLPLARLPMPEMPDLFSPTKATSPISRPALPLESPQGICNSSG